MVTMIILLSKGNPLSVQSRSDVGVGVRVAKNPSTRQPCPRAPVGCAPHLRTLCHRRLIISTSPTGGGPALRRPGPGRRYGTAGGGDARPALCGHRHPMSQHSLRRTGTPYHSTVCGAQAPNITAQSAAHRHPITAQSSTTCGGT